jgi:hypothetical protein
MVTHLFVYGALYALLIGAIGDAAQRGPMGRLSSWQWLDLGASAPVMIAAASLSIAASGLLDSKA